MEVASKAQIATLHQMKKVCRQFTVDKNDALTQAQKAREDLSFSAKKADSRINILERKVQLLQDGEVQLLAREENRLLISQHHEWTMAKARRQLEVDQAEVMKQQCMQESQTESLACQRQLNVEVRRKMKLSHSKALELVKVTSKKDKEVTSLFERLVFVTSSCANSFYYLGFARADREA
jgi:hypothetical protein